MHGATTGTTRATGMGPWRRSMAGALLATTIGATAVGLTQRTTATAPPPGTEMATPVPAFAAPALRWLKGFIDRAFDPHVHCDYRVDDRVPCDWR